MTPDWQYQLPINIDTGEMSDCNDRDSHGQRRWTEAEIERAIEEVRVRKRLT
jgi:hypothetical protein